MNKELFEKIEYLRANANVGYEEAASLLERFDGDLTRAMIELERARRTYSSAGHGENPWDNMFSRGKEECRRHHEHIKRHHHDPDSWYRKLLRAKVQVTHDGETVADVPLIVPIITTAFAPYLTIAGAVIGGLAGYRLREPRKAPKDGDQA